jgi:hypothetical protein
MMSLDASSGCEQAFPDLRVLLGAPLQLVQVGGVLLVLSPVGSLTAPRHIPAVGLDDVVEDRQDAAVGAGGGSRQPELLRREAAAGGEQLVVRPRVVPKRLQQDLLHP